MKEISSDSIYTFYHRSHNKPSFFYTVDMIFKAIIIFVISFFIVLVLNQIGYGSCYEAHCLFAALPKVTLISIVITGVAVMLYSENGGPRVQDRSVSSSDPIQPKIPEENPILKTGALNLKRAGYNEVSILEAEGIIYSNELTFKKGGNAFLQHKDFGWGMVMDVTQRGKVFIQFAKTEIKTINKAAFGDFLTHALVDIESYGPPSKSEKYQRTKPGFISSDHEKLKSKFIQRKITKRAFGVLCHVYEDDDENLVIVNDCGDELLMVHDKWYREIPTVKYKAELLLSQQVVISTSQTTAKWSDLEYFCDIEEEFPPRPSF